MNTEVLALGGEEWLEFLAEIIKVVAPLANSLLNFIAEIVKALAWPVTILILFVLLRRPIVQLIPLLKRLKYKELELEFAQRFAEIRNEAAQAPPAPAEPAQPASAAPPSEQTRSHYGPLIDFEPKAAILAAWRDLERAAASAIIRRSPDRDVSFSDSEMPRLLQGLQILNAHQLKIFEDLRALRNKTVQTDDFPAHLAHYANEYVRAAEDLISHLDRQT